MDQLDPQTVLILAGGVILLIALSLARSLLRRKPEKSNLIAKRSRPARSSLPKRARSRGPLADDLLELAQRAGIKPARIPGREVSRVTDVSPGAAIPLAWGPVEQSIDRAVERLGAKSNDLDSIVERLRLLESQRHLREEEARLLHKMRQLRNRVTHNELSAGEIDSATARTYGRVANALVAVLDKIR